jgi:mannose-1-phosphate guanylyltransferase
MNAILLAAGLGTRLRPLSDTVPKCMVQINGRPLLAYWLDLLLRQETQRILINTHHLPESVREFILAHPARARITLKHESTLLGTAGTLRALPDEWKTGTLFVAHADNLADFDLRAFCRRHHERPGNVELTMLVFDSDTPQSCGIVQEDSRGIVTGFYEKDAQPPGRRANGAVYLMQPAVLAHVATLRHAPAEFTRDVVPHFLGRTQTWFDAKAYLRDIGTPESLQRAREEWALRRPKSEAA